MSVNPAVTSGRGRIYDRRIRKNGRNLAGSGYAIRCNPTRIIY